MLPSLQGWSFIFDENAAALGALKAACPFLHSLTLVHCDLVGDATFAGEEAAQDALCLELEVLKFESCCINDVSEHDNGSVATVMDDDGSIHELVDVAQLSCFPRLRELSLKVSLAQGNTGRLAGLDAVLSACPCLCVLSLDFRTTELGGIWHTSDLHPPPGLRITSPSLRSVHIPVATTDWLRALDLQAMPQLASLHVSRVIFPPVDDVSGDAAVMHRVATWLAASPSTSRALHLCLDTEHMQKHAEYFDTVLPSLAPLRGHLQVLEVEYYCLSHESLKAIQDLLPGISKLLLHECGINCCGADAFAQLLPGVEVRTKAYEESEYILLEVSDCD